MVYIKVTNFDIILQRVVKRGLVTGREIDPLILRKVFDKVPHSIEQLKPHVHGYREILNI